MTALFHSREFISEYHDELRDQLNLFVEIVGNAYPNAYFDESLFFTKGGYWHCHLTIFGATNTQAELAYAEYIHNFE